MAERLLTSPEDPGSRLSIRTIIRSIYLLLIVAKDTKLRLKGRKWPSLKNSRLLIKGEMKFEFP